MESDLQLKLLTSKEIETIYEKCLEVLTKKGMKIDHPHVLKMLDKAGARVDFESRQVRFPRDIIESALDNVPPCFLLAGRDERHDMVLPDPNGAFHVRNGSGAFRYFDPESDVFRNVTLADVKICAQFVEALDEISFCAFPSPTDAPKQTADIHALKVLLENTSKHINVQPYSAESVEYLLELAQVIAGSAALNKRPVISLSPNAFTPLGLKAYDVEVILQSTRLGVPIHCWSLPSAGATSPITIAGSILLMGVEILCMIVLSQLLQPGTPVIANPFPFTTDMATGNSLNSSVEVSLTTAASVEYIKHAYHVPVHTYGFGTDSPVTDCQASTETTLKGLMASLAGADLLSGAGMVESINGFSLIQLLVDHDLVGILRRLNKGVKVDDDTLAWKEILNTDPGGHFLERNHTFEHCREALRPKFFIQKEWEVWNSEGKKDLYARAFEAYKVMKNSLQPHPLPEDVRKELDLIVKKADEKLVK
ncbi:MAG: trimethylamine methyltransferase family protein [Desulfobacterales bacterium]|jgi:trimethylamine:corrinoid methyltransferase-like protein